MTKSRGILRPKHNWTSEQIDQLVKRYPHEKTQHIADDLAVPIHVVYRRAKKLNLTKTPEFLASPEANRLRRGDNVGKAYRFTKGHTPANKGKTQPTVGRMAETQFKKGSKPHNWVPIGSTRYSKEGYLQRKVTDTGYPPADWAPDHKLLWIEHHGPIPKGLRVAFKDGDKENITIENLELISPIEQMRRNSFHTNYPKEVAQLVQLRGAITRQINKRKKQ